MVRVLLFASLREAVGRGEMSVPLPTPNTVSALVEALQAQGEPYASALSTGGRWRVAVNQEMAMLSTEIAAGDEVAIFPPVTGG